MGVNPRSYLSNCGLELEDLDREIKSLQQKLDVLTEFDYPVDEADNNLFWQIFAGPLSISKVRYCETAGPTVSVSVSVSTAFSVAIMSVPGAESCGAETRRR